MCMISFGESFFLALTGSGLYLSIFVWVGVFSCFWYNQLTVFPWHFHIVFQQGLFLPTIVALDRFRNGFLQCSAYTLIPGAA